MSKSSRSPVFTIYSVRDVKAGVFNQPFVEISDDAAVRGFAYAVNNNDIMGFCPSDFELYSIGSFDSELGKVHELVDSGLPILVVRGNEVVRSDSD